MDNVIGKEVITYRYGLSFQFVAWKIELITKNDNKENINQMNLFKKIYIIFSVVALISAFSINTAFAGHGRRQRAKNVIILIPDGCSQSIQTLARWYKGERLTVDNIQVGVVKHEMADSVITDSAAAASAFATGYKTSNGFLSIGPREDTVLSTYQWPEDPETFSYKPLATVMEGAKLEGKATGLAVTCRFSHATPAAWASHHSLRNDEAKEISEQMVYNEIDLVFGGGGRNLDPGYRPDHEDLLQVLLNRGYAIAETKDEMNAVNTLPVYGMFASSHMAPEIDRPFDTPDEPSLAEMTAKAIELLSQDRDGFILMVEGSQVDWAGHNNDPIYFVTDFIEFDKAVKVALDFAKKNGNTLVLAFPDHNTGGMDIGNRAYNNSYTGLTVEALLDPLRGMTRTANAVVAEMGGDDSDSNMIATIGALWGITIDAAECQEIRDMAAGDAGSMSYALARVISKNHTAIGWTSHGHNAEDVPLWAYGPGAPKGLLDNTELAETVADALNLNMKQIQNRLFVDMDDVFGVDGWTLDETDPANPVVKLSGSGASAELPCSKDLLTITKWGKTKTYNLEGVVVYVPDTGRVYVPKQAVKIMKHHGIL
jgi:alkaline phosphatase